KRFGYTNDHIATLCRRNKVLGKFVGRLWYIDAQSLISYFEQAEIERQRRYSELSRQLRQRWLALFIFGVAASFAPHGARAASDPLADSFSAITSAAEQIITRMPGT